MDYLRRHFTTEEKEESTLTFDKGGHRVGVTWFLTALNRVSNLGLARRSFSEGGTNFEELSQKKFVVGSQLILNLRSCPQPPEGGITAFPFRGRGEI